MGRFSRFAIKTELFSLIPGPTEPPIHPLPSWVDDLEGVREIIDRMDLVISVDTCVSHLAGAMGKEVWLLATHRRDWRWGLGERSEWYPSIAILRQERPGDWDAVFDQVEAKL